MSQYTLTRSGPKTYTLNRQTGVVVATIQRRVMQVNLTRSVVHVTTEPAADIDFSLYYQIAKL